MSFEHTSVLLPELLKFLGSGPFGTILDCTGGAGGHSAALKERLAKGGSLYILDRDPQAVAHLEERFRR